jgi:two-component system phosphate regulon sensor histidine kinase PhoR
MSEPVKDADMIDVAVSAAALLGGLQEPALIIDGNLVAVANDQASLLLGPGIEGRDVRLAIRHPQALEHILGGSDADVDVTGIGQLGQPWQLTVRQLGRGIVLVRLFDRAQIVAAEKMRVDFVANASHELRTPLATITGYAETLAEDGDVPPELRRKFARTMLEEARRMLHLIEDLMSLSRIQADRFVTPRDHISIEEVIRGAVQQVRPLQDRAQCEIVADIADNLPPIRGDRTQLVQVLDNLLSNAIRYGCGAPGAAISITAALDRSSVRVIVQDHGPGISPEHLPRLTERFYRVDAGRSRHTGGTGLGLAIVKHIVERHRGKLDIESEAGGGTTVTIRLPVEA